MLDADNEGIEKRVALINQPIKTRDLDLDITEINTGYYSKSLDVEISCHILNVDGEGELETLLKVIKANDSIFADCLNAWQQCLITHNKKISQKDFDKFWVAVYGRYDCCHKKEAKQAGCKCNLQATLQKSVWNFNHPQLNQLKIYLSRFN